MLLRHFTDSDIPVLQRYMFKGMSTDEIARILREWDSLKYGGKYLEMFAVTGENAVVGTISLMENSKSVVSFGFEVFPEYRRKGYALRAIEAAIKVAGEKGFAVVLDQVRTDNAASIALHEKAGFEKLEYEYTNQKGRNVCLFEKTLV